MFVSPLFLCLSLCLCHPARNPLHFLRWDSVWNGKNTWSPRLCLSLCLSSDLKADVIHPLSSLLHSLIASAHVWGSVFFYASPCCYQSTSCSKWEQSALDVDVIWRAAAALQSQSHKKVCLCGFAGLIIYTAKIIRLPSWLGICWLPSCESGLVW